MAGKRGMKRYSLSLRQEVVDKHLKEGISKPQLCKEYGLDPTQVKVWCRWQRKYGLPKNLGANAHGRPKTSGSETLEQKVKRLEMENDLLKKLNELLMEEESKQK